MRHVCGRVEDWSFANVRVGRRNRGMVLLLDDHLLGDPDQDLLPDAPQTITADAGRA
jgi:hypothetical protein